LALSNEQQTNATLKVVGFLPWLWLSKEASIGGFSFVPFFDGSGRVTSSLSGLKDAFPTILSSYYDERERPRENCVVIVDQDAQNSDDSWSLSETSIDRVRWACSLLFLASWSANEYFTPAGSYVNDTSFQLYFQRFTEPIDFISLSYRRRDGRVLYGGPKHGEIHFTMPLHASSCQFQVEIDFLTALNTADSAKSPTLGRLRAVLPLVRLANTDSDVMTLDAEAALMGFAFEQYFRVTGNNKADSLATKFDDVFGVYGKTDARSVQGKRSGIRCKNKQLVWPVAKFWIWELYQYRNAIVHGGLSPKRVWGWSALEHSVMAAFVFPLIVKLGLQREAHYVLSREDEIRCCSVDALLARTDWGRENGSSMNTVWRSTIGERRRETRVAAAVKKAVADLEAKGIIGPFGDDPRI
jgi:hypothetical protein